MEPRLTPWLESALAARGHPPGAPAVARMVGDASTRTYYRVTAPDGATYVLMALADRQGAYVAPGAAASGRPDELPFVNVQRFLAALGWPVPEVYRFDDAAGLLLLEDLGDVTLEQRVKAGDAVEVEGLYGQAVDLLVTLQVEGTPRLDAGVTAFHAAFDEATLRWELDHYYQWGLCRRHGVAPSGAAEAAIQGAFDRVAKELAEAPRVLCHRDYHSRNLMVQAGRLRVLDFQDALQGCAAYDLASLLRDSYVELPEDAVDRLVRRFVDGRREAGAPVGTVDAYRRLFDLQSIQRNLKAAGRFEYFLHTRGDDRYLGWIPGTLAKVRRNLARHPDLHDLRGALAAFVPELGEGA